MSGLAARAKVTQRFVNPTAEWREGVYVFPLPERAAVDHLDMRIGARVIEGRIKEKQAARATYEQAKIEGRKATLVEQERASLASIPAMLVDSRGATMSQSAERLSRLLAAMDHDVRGSDARSLRQRLSGLPDLTAELR